MAQRGGKRPGAGRKPNPNKGKKADPAALKVPPRTAYEPFIAVQAAKLCELGATDLEISDFLGISHDTFYRWKIEFPDLSEAIKVGKEAADDRVERSLYNRAVGYTFPAEKIFLGPGGKVVRASYREHVPPESGAAMMWLKNRRKAVWRDKQEHEHTGKDGGAIEVNVARDAIAGELARLAARGRADPDIGEAGAG